MAVIGSDPGRSSVSTRFGVRGRLLLAFLAISAFAVLAAAAGMLAFREVGDRLGVIGLRVPPAITALELSRSAERIIAAAPALLAAADGPRRDAVSVELAAEVDALNARLRGLTSEGTDAVPFDGVESMVAELTVKLAELDALVARRLETTELIARLRRDVFQTNAEVQRLLAPWLEVLDKQIAAGVAQASSADQAGGGRLASLIQLQRLTETVQRQFSGVVDMLAEASTTERPARLLILDFQLGLGFDDLAATAEGLDPKLRPLLLDQVAKLQGFAEGPNAIADARLQELKLIDEGQTLLADAAGLSRQLSVAVTQAGSAAKQDIASAIRDALGVQRLGAEALVGLVVLSLLTSGLIVWFYVRGNIVRRLTALSRGMMAMVAGNLRTPVEADGSDEIAEMGRAVEVFRHNTLERDQLLVEKAHAAERLEEEVKERTAELEVANTFKSRFLAAASHDLRQPLHALNLFVAQLGSETDRSERDKLVTRIHAAMASMNDLFDALLDMSKLEAGILEPTVTEFPVEHLFKRLEMTFTDAARQKGLRLRIVPSKTWVRSDIILLERVLLNLTSNAVRYTEEGGIVVGARRRGARMRFDVVDSGPGIPRDEHRKIFGEFYQSSPGGTDRSAGVGLGLAIVEGLARLLDHPVSFESRVGRGSRFSISVPVATARNVRSPASDAAAVAADPLPGKLVVVVDDDPLVLESMRGILQKWGCMVQTAQSAAAAIEQLAQCAAKPDVIASDYRLAAGETGIGAISRINAAVGRVVPAFLITGETALERLSAATASGYHVLRKPIAPMALRAILNRLLSRSTAGGNATPTANDASRRRAAVDQAPQPQ